MSQIIKRALALGLVVLAMFGCSTGSQPQEQEPTRTVVVLNGRTTWSASPGQTSNSFWLEAEAEPMLLRGQSIVIDVMGITIGSSGDPESYATGEMLTVFWTEGDTHSPRPAMNPQNPVSVVTYEPGIRTPDFLQIAIRFLDNGVSTTLVEGHRLEANGGWNQPLKFSIPVRPIRPEEIADGHD